jgi:hypothetical protein
MTPEKAKTLENITHVCVFRGEVLSEDGACVTPLVYLVVLADKT